MSQDRAWGDEFTLIGACEVYNVNIVVLSSVKTSNDTEAVRMLQPKSLRNHKQLKTLYLLHWHERHFDSLKQIQPNSESYFCLFFFFDLP